MTSSYPKASSDVCNTSGTLQKATRTAFIFLLFFYLLILREFFPKPSVRKTSGEDEFGMNCGISQCPWGESFPLSRCVVALL